MSIIASGIFQEIVGNPSDGCDKHPEDEGYDMGQCAELREEDKCNRYDKECDGLSPLPPSRCQFRSAHPDACIENVGESDYRFERYREDKHCDNKRQKQISAGLAGNAGAEEPPDSNAVDKKMPDGGMEKGVCSRF